MDPQGVDLWSPGRASGLRRPGRSPFLPDPRPLGTVLLAAGRRGGRSCGPALRRLPPPWPPLRAPPAPCSPPPGVCAGANKVGRMGSPRRRRGFAAACPRPRRGRSRAAPGRSRQPLQPPCRASAHTGGRGPPFPPRRPLGRSSGRCSGGPASGAWGLPPVPRRACPLPGPSSPGAPARSHGAPAAPRPPPPPPRPGAGHRPPAAGAAARPDSLRVA